MQTSNAKERLATRLRLLRRNRGWSQEELAAASGLHRTYIGALERAERNCSLDTLEKLAAAFGFSLSELVNFDPDTPRHPVREIPPPYTSWAHARLEYRL